jgi:RHS repeat-associated protein
MKKYLIIFLLAATSANCFGYYNPSQGRWLSRDPIEELAIQRGISPRYLTASQENLNRFVSNDPVNMFDFLGLVQEGEACDPCKNSPCIIRLFTLVDGGTFGTHVKANVLSLVSEGDCQELHYVWFDCVTKASGPTDAPFDKIIPRSDVSLYVSANLTFLSCDPSAKKWKKKAGAKAVTYTSAYNYGGWWFGGTEDIVWPPR